MFFNFFLDMVFDVGIRGVCVESVQFGLTIQSPLSGGLNSFLVLRKVARQGAFCCLWRDNAKTDG